MTDCRIDVKFFDVVLCVSRALDLLSASLFDHHLRVAYIGARLTEALGLGVKEEQDVVIAGALHDVGAVSSAVRLSLADYALSQYRFGSGQASDDLHRHGLDGYLLLRDFPPFAKAAKAIRFHHVEWNFEKGNEHHGVPVPFASHILHLADRVAVLPDDQRSILEQITGIRGKIAEGSGSLYHPDIVAAFDEISLSESFWRDLVSGHKEEIIRARIGEHNVSLELPDLYDLARLFARIIDYRSPFTATHSSVVSATSEYIVDRLGLSIHQRTVIGVAGFLHDLGKLAVPPEILDKPGKLTLQEMLVVKQHPYYTHRILSMVPGLKEVCTYAALHHERIDGKGYPFRAREIPLGSRIIAVADIFTAIAETRPYRAGMDKNQSLATLDGFVADGAIDGDIVSLVRDNFEELRTLQKASAALGSAFHFPLSADV
jgi:HD-GYP domain-containing protein (c-di-GMP phosphodiesterase class II)